MYSADVAILIWFVMACLTV